MPIYSLERTQVLPITQEQAWEFFSSPYNLPKITPPSMNFRILNNPESPAYAGQIILYKVSPFGGINTHWLTEITHVREGEFFVDEQRSGPYVLWHHQHIFRAVSGGVEMRDIVHYQLPFGWLGAIVHKLLVRKKLESIFSYRYRVLEEMFGSV